MDVISLKVLKCLHNNLIVLLLKIYCSLFQDWSIRIIRLSTSDSGLYKCQANSHPPQFITVNLLVDGELFLSIYNPDIDNITFFVIR